MTLIEYVVLGITWMFSVVAAFTWGEMRGRSQNDKWWHQYGAAFLAQRGALIYGTALYKEPTGDAAPNVGTTEE